MVRVISKIDIDQIVEIGKHHSELVIRPDRIIEEGTICRWMILGEIILEECKIIEVQILEMDMKVIIEMRTLEEVGVGLGKENIQIILEEVTEAVVVGLEPLLTEIGLDVINVGNMIILLRTVQIHKQIMIHKGYNKCII